MNAYKDMIETVFAGRGDGEAVVLSTITFAGAVNNRQATPRGLELGAAGAEYYCVSSTRKTAKRTLDDVVNAYVIICDDVGTKSQEPPVEPSYKLETSPGNFQWGYLLQPFDVSTKAGQEYYDACTVALAAAGYNDPGCRSATRIVRTVDSFNHKNKFTSKIEWLDRETRWDLAELMGEFGLNPTPGAKVKKSDTGEAPATGDLADILKGDNLHGNSLVMVAKKVAAGWADAEIELLFKGMEPHLRAARGADRVDSLFSGELQQMIAGAREKGYDLGTPSLTPEQMARRRAAQHATATAMGAGESQHLAELYSLEEMHEQFIFIESGSLVFNRQQRRHLLSLPDFNNTVAASRTTVGKEGKTKEVSTAKLWLNSEARVSARSVTFSAGGECVTPDPMGRLCANMWDGWHFPDVSAQQAAERGAGLFVKHVEYLFADRAGMFLDWLAHMMQKPSELPHTAWIHVSSREGTGRGWLGIILAALTRGYCAHGMDLVKLLESQFNQVLSGKVLATVDEIREGGGGQWSHAQKLKSLITEDVRTINAKHMSPFVEFNACRWLLFSNHRSAVPLQDGDRRFNVVVNDDAPKDAAYYGRLYEAKKDPAFIAAVGAFLLSRDISGFDASAPAELTEDKQQMIEGMQSPLVAALKDVYAEYPFKMITAEKLRAFACEPGEGVNPKAFGHALEDAGWVRIGAFNPNRATKAVVYCRRDDTHAFKGKLLAAQMRMHLATNDHGEKSVLTEV